MKLNKTIFLIFAAVFAAASLTLTAAAQDTVGSFTSEGTIQFGNKGVTPPVDPEDPGVPQEPPEVPGTGQTGNLTLDVVPHPFFGEYPLPTVNATYNSRLKGQNAGEPAGANAQTFIQVSDARTGGYAGWNVGVSASAFRSGANILNGAELIFLEGTVRGPETGFAPTAKHSVLFCSDTESNEAKIFTAEAGQGIGTWVNRLYPSPLGGMTVGQENEYIQLFIPANSGAVLGETYVSVLTWTLQNAP